jgi:hypothetical protein
MGTIRALFVIIICAVLPLASCATTWTKPGATAGMLKTDDLECQFEAEKAVANNPDSGRATSSKTAVDEACMKARGWEKS